MRVSSWNWIPACAGMTLSLAAFAAPPLALEEALARAQADAPQVAAQRAAVTAAERLIAPAGELPDPKLAAGVDNLPVNGDDRFSLTRDFMTMRKIGVMQEFPGAGKRQLRTERAEAEARKEAAMLDLAEVNLRRDVALAWFDVHFAERMAEELRALAKESELQVTAAQAALAAGRAAAAESFAARLADAQLEDRIIDARRLVARARSNLARFIGAAAERPLASPPDFRRLDIPHGDALHSIELHPHLAMYGPMVAMAQAEVKLAQAEKHPDWSVELAYSQRGPEFSNMVSITATVALPLFERRRQDPAIASKIAMVEQTRAQAEDARRAHVAEIRGLMADWDAAGERERRYQTLLLPLARERSRAALAAYEGGKADLSAVVDARKGEIDTRLAALQAQNELAKAWAQLNFLYPEAKGQR